MTILSEFCANIKRVLCEIPNEIPLNLTSICAPLRGYPMDYSKKNVRSIGFRPFWPNGGQFRENTASSLEYGQRSGTEAEGRSGAELDVFQGTGRILPELAGVRTKRPEPVLPESTASSLEYDQPVQAEYRYFHPNRSEPYNATLHNSTL